MAKKFIIKETYSLEEAGPSFMDRLRGAAAGFRGGTSPASSPSSPPEVDAGETASSAATSSATANYKSQDAIKALWTAYWGLRKKEAGGRFLFDSSEDKQDKTRFASEYLKIVNRESPPDSYQQAIEELVNSIKLELQHSGRGPADPETPDYSKMDTFAKANAAVKDLKSKLSAVSELEPKIVKGIIDSILSTIHGNPNIDLFVLNEASVKTKTIQLSSYLKSVQPELKVKVAQIIIDWANETYNYRLRTRVGKDLAKLIKPSRSRTGTTPASTVDTASSPTTTTTDADAASPTPPEDSGSSEEISGAPGDTHRQQDNTDQENKISIFGDSGKEARKDFEEKYANEHDIDKIENAVKNTFSEPILGIHKYSNVDLIVFDAAKDTDEGKKYYILAIPKGGIKQGDSDIEKMTFSLTPEDYVDSWFPDRKSLKETLYKGLFDKFVKKHPKQLNDSPYKMIGKNKFKLL